MKQEEKYQPLMVTVARILSVLLAVIPLFYLYLLFSVGVSPNADASEILIRNLSSVFALVVMGFFFDFYYMIHTDRKIFFMKSLRIATVALAIAGAVKVLVSLYYLFICLFNGNIIVWFYVGELLIWSAIAVFAILFRKRLEE